MPIPSSIVAGCGASSRSGGFSPSSSPLARWFAGRRVAHARHRHADGGTRRSDCPRLHHRPHPQRSGAGGGAGAAREIARAGRDRAYQQPGRHHGRVRATARFADPAQGAKPLVVVIDGLAASGGYITAIAADHIVAQETSLIGSIGVMFQYPNVGDLLKTLGIKVEEVKSTPLKSSPNGFEPTSPEARAASKRWSRLLCLVPQSGEGAPESRRCGLGTRRRWAHLHRTPGFCAQARRRARRREGGDRMAGEGQEHRSEHPGSRLSAARPAQRLVVPAYRAVIATLDAVGL